jgi:hypothetical protein
LNTYDDGVIFRLRPLHAVFLFVHGRYVTVPAVDASGRRAAVTMHVTTLHGRDWPTDTYLSILHNAGYSYVWGTWCESGNHPYVYREIDDATGLITAQEDWPAGVSRNTDPGETLPIFIGLGFYRLAPAPLYLSVVLFDGPRSAEPPRNHGMF